MKYKLGFLACALCISFSSVLGQGVSCFPFNNLVGISSNPRNTLWIDAKFQTNSFFSSLNTEISPNFTLKKKPRILTYIGTGIRLNYIGTTQGNDLIDGAFFTFGVRAMPIEKIKKAHLIFEISPFIASKRDAGVLRSFLGIGYVF
ncbi:MAG: hypothetical protein ACRCVT_11460 [Leadbetterella sp.]